MTKYEREKTEVELNRNRIYRTTVLSSTAKTESMKKQLAEIACEDYDIKLAFINEVIKELLESVQAENRFRYTQNFKF